MISNLYQILIGKSNQWEQQEEDINKAHKTGEMHTKFWSKICEAKTLADISCTGTSQTGNDTHAYLYHCTTPKQDRTKSTIKPGGLHPN
jgi:hypothetical protein